MARPIFSKDWERFETDINPRLLKRRLETQLLGAMKRAAPYLEGQIKKTIRRGVDPKNAALTILLKGSSKPLMHTGGLRQAVTHEVFSWKLAAAGLFSTAPSRRNRPLVNLGYNLHEGATIPVTGKMRGLFALLAVATSPDMMGRTSVTLTARAAELYAQLKGRGQIFPLRKSTTAIRIPGRPFLKRTLEKPEVTEKIKAIWMAAIVKAITRKPPKGKAAAAPAVPAGGAP